MQKATKSLNKPSFWLVSASFVLAAAGIIVACTNDDATAKPNLVYKDSPGGDVVAKIGDETITLDSLIGDEKLAYIDLQKRVYEFKMSRLNKLMEENLIGKEAKQAGMSFEDFISKRVARGADKISKSEFNAFVKEKRIPESQLNDTLKERINNYLTEKKKEVLVQNYLAKLTKKSPVEVYFKKPKLNIDVDVAGSPLWGNKNASVTIVEFSDFQCPFCSRANDTIKELKKKYKGKIKVAFKHFPLSFHKEAKPASIASMCVYDQDNDKFWKYHDVLFENQKALDAASLEKYAKQVGANVGKFKECLESKKFDSIVEKDLQYGEKLGVRSTPTFFINGELLSGAVPIEQFNEIIDEELSAKN